MFTLLTVLWLVGSSLMIGFVLLARRRRGALARELHELRGALTSARLAVDLLPVLNLDRPSVCRAASDELARSYASLADFEGLLHARLVSPPKAHQQRSESIDLHQELVRLADIWGEAARREGRELTFDWYGPVGDVFAIGARRHFAEVVTNLLSNALRHGEGRIELVARLRSDSLRVEVSDQGPGLKGPLRSAVRRPTGGEHGHGLGVARSAARALGGALTSAPSGSGAKVAFTVPAIHDPTRAASGAASIRSVPE